MFEEVVNDTLIYEDWESDELWYLINTWI
jgi:hypothetical protein